MECGGKVYSFEETLLRRAYYLGEHKLDDVLKSILRLNECCILEEDPKDPKVSHLVNKENFQRLIQKQTNVIKRCFALERKARGFKYLEFAQRHNLRFGDLVSGKYPMIFKDYRRMIHSLKLAWSLYVTLLMKGTDTTTQQRTRGQGSRRSKVNCLTLLFVNIYSQLRSKGISDERDIIKCFKTSLCYEVSVAMNQFELPEGARIQLLPHSLVSNIKRLTTDEQVNLYFSFLQAKSLCEAVPKSFIQETLEKHRKQLSTPHRGVSDQTLELLRQEGREFGKIVKKFYRPEEGFFPTNKATFQFPRGVGGMKGDLVFNNRLTNDLNSHSRIRPEPLVVGLFGQPGQGKSLLIVQILNLFREKFPGLKREELCYMRTSNCKHWDGYHGQPIVVLDDLGQSRTGLDIQEFQTLVSCNPYVLPMAKLSEKGTYFTSEVIITTSNLPYGHILDTFYEGATGIIEPRAFWRRFHFPILVEDKVTLIRKTEPIWVDSTNFVRSGRKTGYSRKLQELLQRNQQSLKSHFVNGKFTFQMEPPDGWIEIETKDCFRKLIDLFEERKRFHRNHSDTWTQTIIAENQTFQTLLGQKFFDEQLGRCSGWIIPEEHLSTDLLCNLSFDAFPPQNPLEVRVEPIVEPLKVRTITAGRGDLFCLKPLQRAMWLALGEFPQYVLTHGTQNLVPAIDRLYQQSSPDDVWISGDYSAATDSVDLKASQALMEGILESIDHEPTRRWAMKELSPHLIFYPKESGLTPVLQKSGQLMGSFLSFPLLCLLNNATAKFAGLKPSQYLINGDDILMRAPAKTYPKWKGQVDEFGLELSLGKNYVSKRFGTINSQLICEGEVTCSGKQRLLDRRVQVLGECLRDLELQMDKNTPDEVQQLFVSLNKKKLSKTVRSVRVPVSHGGLSLSWGERPSDLKSCRTEILVYLHDLFKKITPLSGHICFPYLSVQELKDMDLEAQNQAFNEPVSNVEFLEDFLTRPSIQKVNERCKNHPALRACFLGKNIEDLPPLNFIQCKQIPFNSEKRNEVQKAIDSEFLTMFLTYDGVYNYRLFRDRILKTHLGIKTDVPTHEFLFNLYDREFGCDLLDEVDIRKKSKASKFNLKLFKDRLDSELKPKDFDIPIVSNEEAAKAQFFDVQTILGLPSSEAHSEQISLLEQVILKESFLTELVNQTKKGTSRFRFKPELDHSENSFNATS